MSVRPHPPTTLRGFELWTAFPPDVENGPAISQYIESKDMTTVGPATIIVGNYQDLLSPVPAPSGYNYLRVMLQPGEQWTYTSPTGHTIALLAISKGSLTYADEKPISEGRNGRLCKGQCSFASASNNYYHLCAGIGRAASARIAFGILQCTYVGRSFGAGRT